MKLSAIDIIVPASALLLAVIFQYSGLDIWLEYHFYDEAQAIWPYRNTWLTETVLHKGGRKFIWFIAVAVFAGFLSTWVSNYTRKYRTSFIYLLLAMISGPAIIGILKKNTHIYSPWDLEIFGATEPHIRLFDTVPEGAAIGHAFPAGHASGGFALLSFYFLLRCCGSRYRHHALLIALAIGFIYGLDQQIRGAHMMSHDLATFSICWVSTATLAILFSRFSKNFPCTRNPDANT